MKKFFLYLVLPLILCGCNIESGNTANPANTYNAAKCPLEPVGILDSKDVKTISIQKQAVKESGQIAEGQNIGYAFEAEAGQKLQYSTADDLCIWIYAPDNEKIEGVDLHQTGKYIFQVSVPKGSTTFNLEIGLSGVEAQPIANSFTKSQATQLIQTWLSAKGKIFAPPYDEQLAAKLTTGTRFKRTKGSIKWLRENNAYYLFKLSRVDSTGNFWIANDRGSIDATITEDLTLYANGIIDYNSSSYGAETSSYRFSFQLQGDTWKIESVSGL